MRRIVLIAALLAADARTLTAPRIAAALHRHPSNVKRDADAMVDVGLLQHRDPGKRRPGERGRAATAAYFLPDRGALAVRARQIERDTAGLVERGMQLVYAEAGQEQIAPLLEALAVDGALVQASWFALCDGEPQEFAIAFAGDQAVESAADLRAELRGAARPPRHRDGDIADRALDAARSSGSAICAAGSDGTRHPRSLVAAPSQLCRSRSPPV